MLQGSRVPRENRLLKTCKKCFTSTTERQQGHDKTVNLAQHKLPTLPRQQKKRRTRNLEISASVFITIFTLSRFSAAPFGHVPTSPASTSRIPLTFAQTALRFLNRPEEFQQCGGNDVHRTVSGSLRQKMCPRLHQERKSSNKRNKTRLMTLLSLGKTRSARGPHLTVSG